MRHLDSGQLVKGQKLLRQTRLACSPFCVRARCETHAWCIELGCDPTHVGWLKCTHPHIISPTRTHTHALNVCSYPPY